ncbi:MAG TPA: PTS sugar transporter subunit IIA [Gemmatimonadaceae bacterium]|nr:PTS sugar transporter subunit IIA [Gemmatimonadaceae bacterium]
MSRPPVMWPADRPDVKFKTRIKMDSLGGTQHAAGSASGRQARTLMSVYSATSHGAVVLLSELLSAERVKVPLDSRTKNEVLEELVRLVAPDRQELDTSAVLASVRERETVLSTGIGGGVAIPHGKTPDVDQLVLAAGVSRTPIDFDALDGKPVQLFFLLVGPESAAGAHVKALSRISRLLRRESLRSGLLAAESAEEFLRVIRASEAA